jgi:hypothetical protein
MTIVRTLWLRLLGEHRHASSLKGRAPMPAPHYSIHRVYLWRH